MEDSEFVTVLHAVEDLEEDLEHPRRERESEVQQRKSDVGSLGSCLTLLMRASFPMYRCDSVIIPKRSPSGRNSRIT